MNLTLAARGKQYVEEGDGGVRRTFRIQPDTHTQAERNRDRTETDRNRNRKRQAETQRHGQKNKERENQTERQRERAKEHTSSPREVVGPGSTGDRQRDPGSKKRSEGKRTRGRRQGRGEA